MRIEGRHSQLSAIHKKPGILMDTWFQAPYSEVGVQFCSLGWLLNPLYIGLGPPPGSWLCHLRRLSEDSFSRLPEIAYAGN